MKSKYIFNCAYKLYLVFGLVFLLLVQSCTKDKTLDQIAPKSQSNNVVGSTALNSKNTAARIDSAAERLTANSVALHFRATQWPGAPTGTGTFSAGNTIDMFWYNWPPYHQPQAPIATTARVEFYASSSTTVPVVIIQHVILWSGYGLGPTENAVTFTIPGFMPVGNLSVRVITDDPTTSLVDAPTSGPFVTEADGSVTITGYGTRVGTDVDINPLSPSGTNSVSQSAGSFSINWNVSQFNQNASLRLTLLNATFLSDGPGITPQFNPNRPYTYYMLAPGYAPSGSGVGPNGYNNYFLNSSTQPNAINLASDIPKKSYKILLDDSQGNYVFSYHLIKII